MKSQVKFDLLEAGMQLDSLSVISFKLFYFGLFYSAPQGAASGTKCSSPKQYFPKDNSVAGLMSSWILPEGPTVAK